MNHQRHHPSHHLVLTKSIAFAIGILSIFGSSASAAELIPRMLSTTSLQTRASLLWDVNRSGYLLRGHRKKYRHFGQSQRAPFMDPSFLLGLRGGAAKADKKKEETEKAEAEEVQDLDKILESELIEEIETVGDDAETDDEDENEAANEEEEEEEEEEETEGGTELEDSREYDEPLVAPVMMQLYATFGVMILSKKLDLYNPTVVKVARFAFVGYLVVLQLFLLYVRIRAKAANNRTPVTIPNPFSGLVESQLGPAGSNDMVKNLASSFLKSESTVLEYDLKQAKSMQGGLIFNMAFMWFLHFKMEQIQPLLINTVSGFMNLIYSPLFQAYVLGRNLERPFKNPAMQQYENAAAAAAAAAPEADSKGEEVDDVDEAIEAEESVDDEADAKEDGEEDAKKE